MMGEKTDTRNYSFQNHCRGLQRSRNNPRSFHSVTELLTRCSLFISFPSLINNRSPVVFYNPFLGRLPFTY